MADPKNPGSSGKRVILNDGYQAPLQAMEKKGYQAVPARDPSGVQGGYQGPTGQGAPTNTPSGGSSGGSNKK